MKGLLIEVDFTTGTRPPGINPRSRRMPGSPSWQSIERGLEVRLVSDEDAAAFADVPGVRVLHDEAAIEAAVAALQPPEEFAIAHEALLVESIRQKRIDISYIPADTQPAELARLLHERGALGVTRQSKAPIAVERVAALHNRNRPAPPGGMKPE